MPAITLRLSDEQHERVREWAFASRRSIQRELEARLFEDGVLAERDGAGVVAESQSGGGRAQKPRDGDSRTPGLEASRSANVPEKPAEVSVSVRKVCARAFAHHNYHAGKPCPHCGYPDTP